MPDTPFQPTIDALRRLAVSTLAYALAVAVVASAIPAFVHALPAERLLPEPPLVVARVPVAPPATGPAPNLVKAAS